MCVQNKVSLVDLFKETEGRWRRGHFHEREKEGGGGWKREMLVHKRKWRKRESALLFLILVLHPTLPLVFAVTLSFLSVSPPSSPVSSSSSSFQRETWLTVTLFVPASVLSTFRGTIIIRTVPSPNKNLNNEITSRERRDQGQNQERLKKHQEERGIRLSSLLTLLCNVFLSCTLFSCKGIIFEWQRRMRGRYQWLCFCWHRWHFQDTQDTYLQAFSFMMKK